MTETLCRNRICRELERIRRFGFHAAEAALAAQRCYSFALYDCVVRGLAMARCIRLQGAAVKLRLSSVLR